MPTAQEFLDSLPWTFDVEAAEIEDYEAEGEAALMRRYPGVL